MTDNPFSLEDALRSLEDIVNQLESGDQTLDEAVALFEKGQEIAQRCIDDLDAKELRIQQITQDGDLASLE